LLECWKAVLRVLGLSFAIFAVKGF
jgi:hypothetical protein